MKVHISSNAAIGFLNLVPGTPDPGNNFDSLQCQPFEKRTIEANLLDNIVA